MIGWSIGTISSGPSLGNGQAPKAPTLCSLKAAQDSSISGSRAQMVTIPGRLFITAFGGQLPTVTFDAVIWLLLVSSFLPEDRLDPGPTSGKLPVTKYILPLSDFCSGQDNTRHVCERLVPTRELGPWARETVGTTKTGHKDGPQRLCL